MTTMNDDSLSEDVSFSFKRFLVKGKITLTNKALEVLETGFVLTENCA